MKDYLQILSCSFFVVAVINCGALVVGDGFVCGDWGLLALVMDSREVMLTSPTELAHCERGEGGCVCVWVFLEL